MLCHCAGVSHIMQYLTRCHRSGVLRVCPHLNIPQTIGHSPLRRTEVSPCSSSKPAFDVSLAYLGSMQASAQIKKKEVLQHSIAAFGDGDGSE